MKFRVICYKSNRKLIQKFRVFFLFFFSTQIALTFLFSLSVPGRNPLRAMDLRVQVRLLLAHMTTASLHPPPQLAWVWCPEVSPNLPRTSPVAQMVKCLPTIRETRARSLGRKDPLEQEMATHSSTLAWQIPWMEEPGRLQSTGSQRVRHD